MTEMNKTSQFRIKDMTTDNVSSCYTSWLYKAIQIY